MLTMVISCHLFNRFALVIFAASGLDYDIDDRSSPPPQQTADNNAPCFSTYLRDSKHESCPCNDGIFEIKPEDNDENAETDEEEHSQRLSYQSIWQNPRVSFMHTVYPKAQHLK